MSKASTDPLKQNLPCILEYKFRASPFSVRGHITQVLDELQDAMDAPELLTSLELVLAELLNNVVEHGYANTDKGHIVLKVTADQDAVFVETQDQGVPMPNLVPPDPPPPNIDVDRQDLQEGHFGWFMIRELSQDLKYVRAHDTNHISLRLS